MSANNQIALTAVNTQPGPIGILVDRDDTDRLLVMVISDQDCGLVFGEGSGGAQFPVVANRLYGPFGLDRGTKLSAVRGAVNSNVFAMYWRDPTNELLAAIASLNECISELVCLIKGGQ